ncbi:hypothetical protein C1N60_23445 (plasmid) [Pantoea sp. SGAir0184]
MKPLLMLFSNILAAYVRLHIVGGFGTEMTILMAVISTYHAAKPAVSACLFPAFKSLETGCRDR